MNELALNITHLPYLDSAELFENVADEPWAILLDSGVEFSVVRSTDEGSSSNRYDVLVVGPSSTLVFDGKITTFTMHTGSGRVQNLYGDPMAILQAAIPECERLQSRTYLPGAYGYFSYDLARQYESIPDVANDEEQLPQMAMGIYPTVLVVDHKRKKSRVIRMGDSDHAKAIERRWLDLVLDHQANLVARELEQIEGSDDVTQSNNAATLGGQSLQESLSWPQYQAAFDMIREYTIAGDCYQVNLTKQFTSKVHTDAWQVYKQLRATSPAPYGSYMNLPFAQILSNSPESFIQCRNRKVVTSPIKGTRPRNHSDHEADREIAISLQLSKKDRAENLMIVDLMRNDLSRACELGSVKVPELFALHSFANVHHLISRVEDKWSPTGEVYIVVQSAT